MIVAIHQPDYLPWLGFFYKMAHCDYFVYLDDAQYSNEACHNANLIKTSNGSFRLKIPVEQHFGDKINAVRTRDELRWKEKHLRILQLNYSRAPFFKEIYQHFADLLCQHYSSLADLNIAINSFICTGFAINPKVLRSSEMFIYTTREQRVIDICKKLGGDEYLSGKGAKAYQNIENFLKANIKLTYLKYQPITYKQLWGEFLPCMSVIDYIFNHRFDWNQVEQSVEDLSNGNR